MSTTPDPFAALRPRLFGIAYRIVNGAAEAEEIAADGDGDGAVDGDAEALETPRAPVAAPPGATSSKRERRRQRRATRPHGRAR